MILAAGLTPAWQYVLVFNELTTGEVNRAGESRWFASGKAVNVALAAHSLGHAANLVSFIGGATGSALAEDFESTGATANWVTSAAPTRVCTTLIDRSHRQTTELVENSLAVSPQELNRYQRTFAGAARNAKVIALSGSLPTDTPRTCYRELLESASQSPALATTPNQPARLVLDIRGPELLDCLPFRPFLVKPNREELAATIGRSLDDDAALLSAMRELNQKGAEWVLVTDGAKPTWLSGNSGQWRAHPPVGVEVVNPIGCGDSVAAGIAAGLAEELRPQDCIALGLGSAAANLERMQCARFESNRAREWARRVTWSSVNAP